MMECRVCGSSTDPAILDANNNNLILIDSDKNNSLDSQESGDCFPPLQDSAASLHDEPSSSPQEATDVQGASSHPRHQEERALSDEIQVIRDDIEILVDVYLFFEKFRWTLHSFLF